MSVLLAWSDKVILRINRVKRAHQPVSNKISAGPSNTQTAVANLTRRNHQLPNSSTAKRILVPLFVVDHQAHSSVILAGPGSRSCRCYLRADTSARTGARARGVSPTHALHRLQLGSLERQLQYSLVVVCAARACVRASMVSRQCLRACWLIAPTQRDATERKQGKCIRMLQGTVTRATHMRDTHQPVRSLALPQRHWLRSHGGGHHLGSRGRSQPLHRPERPAASVPLGRTPTHSSQWLAEGHRLRLKSKRVSVVLTFRIGAAGASSASQSDVRIRRNRIAVGPHGYFAKQESDTRARKDHKQEAAASKAPKQAPTYVPRPPRSLSDSRLLFDPPPTTGVSAILASIASRSSSSSSSSMSPTCAAAGTCTTSTSIADVDGAVRVLSEASHMDIHA